MSDDTVTLTFRDDDRERVPLEIPRHLGRVRLLEPIGDGAMGVVWRGTDDLLNRPVAVKLLRHLAAADDAERLQFFDGARAAATVQHPNVVAIYHADAIDDVVFIVMEYAGGGTLRDALAHHGAMDRDLALLVTCRCLDALGALHAADVVHRDVKPANVLFDDRGTLKVSDFGLCLQRRSGGDVVLGGTPGYMAPEMFEGEVSLQSDIYAVGVMLCELLIGRCPFTGSSLAEFRQRHRDGALPMAELLAAGIDDDGREIIERCTHKRRIFRYKSAQHMMQAIERWQPGLARREALDRRLRDAVQSRFSTTPAPETDQRPAGAPPSGTYFDLLSDRARAKRDRRME